MKYSRTNLHMFHHRIRCCTGSCSLLLVHQYSFPHSSTDSNHMIEFLHGNVKNVNFSNLKENKFRMSKQNNKKEEIECRNIMTLTNLSKQSVIICDSIFLSVMCVLPLSYRNITSVDRLCCLVFCNVRFYYVM